MFTLFSRQCKNFQIKTSIFQGSEDSYYDIPLVY
jgi:hypothetical protein